MITWALFSDIGGMIRLGLGLEPFAGHILLGVLDQEAEHPRQQSRIARTVVYSLIPPDRWPDSAQVP